LLFHLFTNISFKNIFSLFSVYFFIEHINLVARKRKSQVGFWATQLSLNFKPRGFLAPPQDGCDFILELITFYFSASNYYSIKI